MKYDPIKRKLGVVFNKTPFLRKLFYRLLDVLLLRSWHVHKALKEWEKSHPGKQQILDAGSGFGQYVETAQLMLVHLPHRFENIPVDRHDASSL
jgi:hypothetical protein